MKIKKHYGVGKNNPNWRGGKFFNCLICKKEFWAKPSKVQKGHNKFCSRKCYGIWIHKNRSGKNSPAWRGGKVKCICKTCGRNFYVVPAEIKRGKGKFCSRECFAIWHSKNMSGKNNYQWKGGISFEPYSIDWTSTLKRSIRERDHYICQKCGKLQSDKAFCVHHIDSNKLNCNPNNLITLCASCHIKLHNKKQDNQY